MPMEAESLYSTIVQLTSSVGLTSTERARKLNAFTQHLGWRPSDRMEVPWLSSISTGHVLIEHGLEHAAVISFLQSPRRYSELLPAEKLNLHSLAYNNLVDWCIPVEADQVQFVYIRTRTATLVDRYQLSPDNLSRLHSEAFEEIVDRKPSANIPSLDDALIKTVSFWKRNIFAELRTSISNSAFSHLFNAIFFARALEDLQRGSDGETSDQLLQYFAIHPAQTLKSVLARAIGSSSSNGQVPSYLFDPEVLSVFDGLHPSTAAALLGDFYRNRFAPFRYDFSVMSKHALSRIYEQYVSLMRDEQSEQLSFLPELPKQTKDRSQGAVYTPQFIARFFARYLREQVPPFTFKRMRSIDPACGSGIFLRTLLEFQCDPLQDGTNDALVKAAFDHAVGFDRDDNAIYATRLSLALLHLVLTNTLPEQLHLYAEDAVKLYQTNPLFHGSFDAVLANPPFVPLDRQDDATRVRMQNFLDSDAVGKIDTYLAFLKLGLMLLKPGGYGCFVVPHSFLLGRNGSKIRQLIAEQCWIRCLADLSAVRVFDDVGAYVILLVFQKKTEQEPDAPPALVIQCHDMVAHALQDAVEGRYSTNDAYSIYEAEQELFATEDWLVLPPIEAGLRRRLTAHPVVSEFLEIRQGFVTGSDDVFILPATSIPKGEKKIFAPYLHDREIDAYVVPNASDKYVFYPFVDGEKLDERTLRQDFPGTWEYLKGHKKKLEKRGSLVRYKKKWWEPLWPRAPEHLMRPKIVTPHLVLVPRFALDSRGKFAVSHSPFLYPRVSGADEELLKYFVAILNSSACYWHISSHSHKYQNGYTMLEGKTLEKTPVPDPTKVSAADMQRLLRLVDLRMRQRGLDAVDTQKQLDDFVAHLYGLTSEERVSLGMEQS